MFKKIVIATALVVLGFSGLAFAGALPATSDSFKYSLSSNVTFDYVVTATTFVNYAMSSKHKAGNRFFSTSNQTTNIWFKEAETYVGLTMTDSGAQKQGTPGALDANYSGWSSL